MPLRSDFKVLVFNEHLGDKESDLNTEWPWKGNSTSTLDWRMAEPKESGYLLIQTYDVGNSNHKIIINDTDLPEFDIPKQREYSWNTWMDIIEEGVMNSGSNSIRIVRAEGGDNFMVGTVVIHWREEIE